MTAVLPAAETTNGPGVARRLVRRSAWLMLGAAIGTAAVIAGYGLASMIAPDPPVWILVVVLVIAVACLGLVPGARELEVTAARTMLGARAELNTPTPARGVHRLQTMGWVLAHVGSGLAAGFVLLGLAPGAVIVIARVAAGRSVAGLGLPVPSTVPGRALEVGLVVVVLLACLAAFWLIGLAMAAVVGSVLGPTATDRLTVARARIAREAEHTRLARELHDGIGHALTIVGVQAAAGRRALGRDDGDRRAAEALAAIEDTSRSALTELDTLLRLLREDGPATAHPVDLDDLIRAHRRTGLDIEASIDLPQGLAALFATTVQRIVGEALTNAQRYAGEGAVRLVVAPAGSALTITVTSRLDDRRRRRPGGPLRRGGWGLAGIAERAALFGGTVDAGPGHDTWQVRAVLPLPSRSTDG